MKMAKLTKMLTHPGKNESGQGVLAIVLILLMLGAVILTPLLVFMQTGLKAGQVYESKVQEFYAADAGAEDAMWKLINGKLINASYDYSYQLPAVNGKEVNVTIDEIEIANLTEETHGLNAGDKLWWILSTATTDTNSSTTVESYFAIAFRLAGADTYEDYSGTGDIKGVNVTVEEGDTVTGNIAEGANVWAEGGFNCTGNVEKNATVNVVGDAYFGGAGNIIDGAIVRVFGNCTINGNIKLSEVYVSENLILWGSIQLSEVAVGGDLYVDGNIESDVYVGGTVTWGGSNDGTNLGLDEVPFDIACPLGAAVPIVLTYEIS